MLNNEIEKLKDKALSSVKGDFNIKTACDYVLSQNIDNVFKKFESEEIAKQIISETISNLDANKALTKPEKNKIYKVFKLLQYFTIISEQLYVVKTTIELYEGKCSEDNEHIYIPLIQILHEGMVNRILKIYDKTEVKKERSFSLINIQKDFFKEQETVSQDRYKIRNSILAHLSLDHEKCDTEMIEDYTELYKDLKTDILGTIGRIAPCTAEFVSKIVLLNDLPNANSIGRLYSNKNYHKLVMHTDEKFKEYYIQEDN